jgi:hypothetical protein
MGRSAPVKPIPRDPSDPEGDVVAARLFKWGPGQLGVEFEFKGGRHHARRVIVPEEVAEGLSDVVPWDGSEPH